MYHAGKHNFLVHFQNVCRVYGGTLAVVNSAEENTFLNDTFLQNTGGSTNGNISKF